MNKKRACDLLAKAISYVAGELYDDPVVKGPPDGFEHWTLCWKGPPDWTMLTCGSSITSGLKGDYSLPVEREIEKALKAIEDGGLYFEVMNGNHIVPFER